MSKRDNDFEEDLYRFKRFIQIEGFTEAIDKVGSFELGSPLFYKQLLANKFLVFNIPFNEVQKDFYADFWAVDTSSKDNFLKRKITESKLTLVCLAFKMQNVKIYNNLLLPRK